MQIMGTMRRAKVVRKGRTIFTPVGKLLPALRDQGILINLLARLGLIFLVFLILIIQSHFSQRVTCPV